MWTKSCKCIVYWIKVKVDLIPSSQILLNEELPPVDDVDAVVAAPYTAEDFQDLVD